jgi:hypothetical protein
MESVHARFGGEGLVFLGNQDLASYPTSRWACNGFRRLQHDGVYAVLARG